MANFLVRETLGYEEFSEALHTVMGGTDRCWPCWKKFWFATYFRMGLVGWWLWVWLYGGHGTCFWWFRTSTWSCRRPAAAASPEQGADASASAAPGSSPSHRAPAASEHSAPGPESESGKPKTPQDVSEVSLADSFLMGVLRGGVCWRPQASPQKKLETFCPLLKPN